MHRNRQTSPRTDAGVRGVAAGEGRSPPGLQPCELHGALEGGVLRGGSVRAA